MLPGIDNPALSAAAPGCKLDIRPDLFPKPTGGEVKSSQLVEFARHDLDLTPTPAFMRPVAIADHLFVLFFKSNNSFSKSVLLALA